jgi:hypothetical protein
VRLVAAAIAPRVSSILARAPLADSSTSRCEPCAFASFA